MRMKKLAVVGICLVAIVAAAGVYAQQRSGKQGKLSAEDWVEIYTLYGKYTHLIDNGEDKGYAYARLWTEDAIFEFGGQQHKGRDELANVAMYGIEDPPIVRPLHHAFNIVIEPSPEGARGTAYLALIAAQKPKEPHVILTRGIYNDIFVKTKDGWRFKYRKFTPAAFSTEGNTTTARVPPKPQAR
jgi:hypothetical protein